MRKAEIKRLSIMEEYITNELKTGRHILACLGSAGLTFNDDIGQFKVYLKSKGNENLIRIIEENKELSESELNDLNRINLKGGIKNGI